MDKQIAIAENRLGERSRARDIRASASHDIEVDNNSIVLDSGKILSRDNETLLRPHATRADDDIGRLESLHKGLRVEDGSEDMMRHLPLESLQSRMDGVEDLHVRAESHSHTGSGESRGICTYYDNLCWWYTSDTTNYDALATTALLKQMGGRGDSHHTFHLAKATDEHGFGTLAIRHGIGSHNIDLFLGEDGKCLLIAHIAANEADESLAAAHKVGLLRRGRRDFENNVCSEDALLRILYLGTYSGIALIGEASRGTRRALDDNAMPLRHKNLNALRGERHSRLLGAIFGRNADKE